MDKPTQTLNIGKSNNPPEHYTDSHIEKDKTEKKKLNNNEDTLFYLNIPIYKNFKLHICKPLIILKLALFIWYGTGSAVAMFLIVFLKKRGITLPELSLIFVIVPPLQLLGPTICGIIADKIGRSKIVLVINLLLTTAIITGLLLSPSMLLANCEPQTVTLECNEGNFDINMNKTDCNLDSNFFQLKSCNVSCPADFLSSPYNDTSSTRNLLKRREYASNMSIFAYKSSKNKTINNCYYNISTLDFNNSSYQLCNIPRNNSCNINCFINLNKGCSDKNRARKGIFVTNLILIVLFSTVFSNTYRFMDVTTMFQTKRYNSDFGLHRIFSVAGILVFSPFIGYIIDLTSIGEENKNYETAFYFFIGMVLFLLIILYKFEVHIRPPGKNMWRKSLFLLKNPDVIVFIIVLVVLGTAWNFNKNFIFLFLSTMKPPSFLLGLVNSASALYGLPFLITSNWWIKKLGAPRIFLLALLGYFASGMGYSMLYNPWFSLLIEVSNIFTYHLMWVAVIEHSHSIAPEGLTATVIATAGGIHFSIGNGIGGLIGGLLTDAYGSRTAYRVMGLTAFSTAVLYSVYLYLRKNVFPQKVKLDTNGTQNAAYTNEEKS